LLNFLLLFLVCRISIVVVHVVVVVHIVVDATSVAVVTNVAVAVHAVLDAVVGVEDVNSIHDLF